MRILRVLRWTLFWLAILPMIVGLPILIVAYGLELYSDWVDDWRPR